MRRPATETAPVPPEPVLPMLPALLGLLALLVLHVQAVPLSERDCAVTAQLNAGRVCGLQHVVGSGTLYASFLGVPYARQPVGELRFKELQPPEQWSDLYDATAERAVCPQHDVLYGALNDRNMDEACIYANVHVPLHALPGHGPARPPGEYRRPHEVGLDDDEGAGLPILVFVHGGGFAFGSGGAALHGPDYLMPEDVIVITFNYRLNVFGFLSLNTSYVPGNNGLRDMVTLLRWVRDNAESFGGNPDDVTLAGQSAGAISAHLLTLSEAAEGLFSRAIIMSGTANSSFYTPSPLYAQFVSNMFLSLVGINSTDPGDVHQQLVELPLERIMRANEQIQDQFGLTAFVPVVESSFPGVTTILHDDPQILMSRGCGSHIPLIIGFTNAECEVFRRNFEHIDILQRIKKNPLVLLPIKLIYELPLNVASQAAERIRERYFGSEPTMDEYVQVCTDAYYIYPALRVAMMRRRAGGAPAYLYEFSYEADFSVIKEITGSHNRGADHIEDLTFLFRAKALEHVKVFKSLSHRDRSTVELMTTFVRNFINSDDPSCVGGASPQWPSVAVGTALRYQLIDRPQLNQRSGQELSEQRTEMVEFFDILKNGTS